MSELKKIEAPALSPNYGNDIDTTFDNIQENFDVLANQELYKGDTGRNLITTNLPWSDVFTTAQDDPIGVNIGDKIYYLNNFSSAIKTEFGEISDQEDVDAAVEALKESGNITICFEDVDTTASTPISVLSSIPFVFVDPRFRNFSSSLEGRVDMSCVITCTGEWKCTQNFPTLYYKEGNLYWKINGQNTNILAQGPSGKDGSTGTVYVGLSDNLKIDTVLSTTGSTQVNITYLLQHQIISSSSSRYDDLEEDSQSHLPFVTIADWVELNGEPINGAPIIVMGESSDPVDNLGVPYYISELIYNGSDYTCTCNVSKYNICYAHMNDSTVKQALRNNVLFRAASPATEGVNELKGVSIKERGAGTGGYSIFVPYNGILTISYVNNINDPTDTQNSNKSKFKIYGSLAEGYNTTTGGECSHAEGYNTEAHGYASHAEGEGTLANEYAHAEGYNTTAGGDSSHAEGEDTEAQNDWAHAEGHGTIASGLASHAEGYVKDTNNIKAAGKGSHAEGYVENEGDIISSGNGSHAEGCSSRQSTIYATNDGAHAEGYVEGTGNYIKASGKGSHAEGYVDNGNIEASGKGAHAEGSGTAAIGDFSHAMGEDSIAVGDNSFVSGYQCSAGAYACINDNHSFFNGSVTINSQSEVVHLNVIFYNDHGINIGDWVYIDHIDIDQEITIKGLLKCSAISGNTVQFDFNDYDNYCAYDKLQSIGTHIVDCTQSKIINVSKINRTPPSQDWVPYKADQSISMGNQCISLGENSSSIGKSNVTIWSNESSQGCYNLPGYVRYSNVYNTYWISSLWISGEQNDETTLFTIGAGTYSGPINTRNNSLVVSNKGNIYKSTPGGLTKI